MSSTTQTSKPNFMSLANDYLLAQKKIADAQRESLERSREFFNSIKSNIHAYNTVVRNLALKFNSEQTPFSTVYDKLYINPESEFVRIEAYTQQYVFSYKGMEQKVPMVLLTNNPIVVAQYVRKQIRSIQDAAREKAYQEAKAAKNKASREFKQVERNLENAERMLNLVERQQAKRAKMITERLQKKIKKRDAQKGN
jgi:hypothetical protein